MGNANTQNQATGMQTHNAQTAPAPPQNQEQAAQSLMAAGQQPLAGSQMQQPESSNVLSNTQGLPGFLSQLSSQPNQQNNLQSVPLKLGG